MKSWACPGTATMEFSKLRTGNLRCSTTPTATRGVMKPRKNSKEAAEAYSVLSDGQKRAAYDRFGHQGVPSAAGGGFDASGF